MGSDSESLGVVVTPESESESFRSPQSESESEPGQHHTTPKSWHGLGIRVGGEVVQSRGNEPGVRVGIGVGQQSESESMSESESE